MTSRTESPALRESLGCESEIYTRRFSQREEWVREITWRVLCRDFFQQFVPSESLVLDIGAGDGLFLQHIRAARRVAVDLSPHVKALEEKGIEVLLAPATELSARFGEQADVIFMSNFLEHLPSKQLVLDVLGECRKVLKPGGRLLILQPNIRYVGPAYWDYVDHHIALTEHSLQEALDISGFSIDRLIPRFLPYTAKSSTGRLAGRFFTSSVVETYLKVPLLWRIFGAQTFVVARNKSGGQMASETARTIASVGREDR